MKIAIIGFGKMGKNIKAVAESRNHEIIYIADRQIDTKELKKADVAIEFSVPEAAFENISTCIKEKVPVVSGTTGWLSQFDEAKQLVELHQSKFLYASNFSIGVNIFFKLNSVLAKLMSAHKNYDLDIEEIHHTEKKDAPSGTAITLAEQIIKDSDYTTWSHPARDEENDIPIHAFREEGVHGTHIINYKSAIDTISIKHEAHTRKGFAQGAVLAAEWLAGVTNHGCYDLQDVLKL
jgi:4-hydroxy-tetrahydrodipicolinate reductase